MFIVRIQVSPGLRSLLYARYRGPSFDRELAAKTSVKDLVEACGIPHTEIDMLRVDGEAVDFQCGIDHAVSVEVYGCDEVPAGSAGALLQSRAPRRFALDGHLGKLARHLRLLGFDTAYRSDIDDQELMVCADEDRALLTRDRRLLMRRELRHGYCPRSDEAVAQTQEVLRRFRITADEFAPFTRCLRCNGRLLPVDKQAVESCLEPLTKRYFERFHQCPGCGRIFWSGSHTRRLWQLVDTFGGRG